MSGLQSLGSSWEKGCLNVCIKQVQCDNHDREKTKERKLKSEP